MPAQDSDALILTRRTKIDYLPLITSAWFTKVSVDSEGDLYLAEVFNGRVQKLRAKPGADHATLIGQITDSLTR